MGNALCARRPQHSARLASRAGAAPSPAAMSRCDDDHNGHPALGFVPVSVAAPSPAMSRYDDHNGHPALGFIVAVPLALPSPAMSRYDDHNGHRGLDFVPGRPLVDEPTAASSDEPSWVILLLDILQW